MERPLKILLLEDSAPEAEIIKRQLLKQKMRCEFYLAMDKEDFLHALDEFSPDVILSDNSLPQFDATEALKITRERSLQIPFILVTGTVSDEFAANIIKEGADDFILKDRLTRLSSAIDAALLKHESEKEKLTALKNLFRSEEKFRVLIQRITDAFIALDKNWCYTYLNKKAGELIHRNPADVIGKNMWSEFPDAVGSSTYEAFHKAMKEQQYVTNIDYYAPFDLWQENHIYPSKDGLSVFIRDITEKKKAEEALISNELRFRTLTSNAPVGIFQTDAAGKTIYVNETWQRITRLTFDEAMGDGWQTMLHPDDKEIQQQQWQDKSMKGLESSSEFRLVDKKGNTRWVTGKATPVFNNDQRITGYIGTLEDITERKKAEEDIQKSEEQYRDLVENITDLICTHDLDGRILSVNKAAEDLMGRKFNPLGNLNIKDILAPDKKDLFDHYINELKKNGSVQGLMKIQTFKGKIHIWEYNNSLKTIGVATPIVRGYARDITESRKAEEKLRQNEIRLNEAQAIAHISNWEIDLATNKHAWSDEFYRIYGLDKDEIQPSAELFLSYMHPEDAAVAQRKMQEALDTLKDSSFNFRFIRKDGVIRHGYTEWRFEFDKKGKPLRLYGIVQDITERKEAEEKRKILEAELFEQQRNEQLKITSTALEAQEKERNAIGEEIHDNVNQILVGTKIMLSLAKNRPAEAQELIATAINSLQDAIYENRKIAHELVTPDFGTTKLAEQIINLTDIMLKTSGIDVFIDTVHLTEELLDDQQKLAIYRIAQEQCTNIVKYAKASLTNIFFSTDEGLFKMVISDDGKGAEAKKTEGIGLRNIKGRLSVFNGNVNISTAPGKGFTLEITIPIKKP